MNFATIPTLTTELEIKSGDLLNKLKTNGIQKNTYFVVITESEIGNNSKKDLAIFLTGEHEAEVFQAFEHVEDARAFVVMCMETNLTVECAIYNCKGEHLKTYSRKSKRIAQFN